MRKKFLAGNWKMFKNSQDVDLFIKEFTALLSKESLEDEVRIGICPPSVFIDRVKKGFLGKKVDIFSQNIYFENEGAYTGEVSAPMISSIGAVGSIVGHSERRELFGDSDEIVNSKVKSLIEENMEVILCVGESLNQREEGRAKDIVSSQIKLGLAGISKQDVDKVTIAYEPIWAIGTGKTATADEAEEMCGYIRKIIEEIFDKDVAEEIIIQYGGSVKPDNARELLAMENIDGALIGGASLQASSFMNIIKENIK